MPTRVVISLGSNQKNPRLQLQRAILALDQVEKTQLIRSSGFYQTSAVGFIGEDFINAVVEVDTELTALQLLDALHKIEKDQGRIRVQRWSSRIIDLDIIFFGNEVHRTERLSIPKTEMIDRLFVLVPLAEFYPHLELPGNVLIQDRITELTQTTDQKIWLLDSELVV